MTEVQKLARVPEGWTAKSWRGRLGWLAEGASAGARVAEQYDDGQASARAAASFDNRAALLREAAALIENHP